MNFRQIKMLNDLEAKTAELEQDIKDIREQAIREVLDRLHKLENPPKRRPGRPRKIVNNE